MKNAGKFDKIEGLIIGGMTDMRPDNYFASYQEVVKQLVNSLPNKKFPIAFGINVGHIKVNIAVLNGAVGEMIVDNSKTQIIFN
jgi:muramoyltetrapeptide carboxypeptidase LdcA involved in peptidoglycan recycling